MRRFSAMVPLNRNAFWGTQLIRSRSSSWEKLRTSELPSRIWPDWTSWSRSRRSARVLFPDPMLPITAVV